jgi:hypothetical protein
MENLAIKCLVDGLVRMKHTKLERNAMTPDEWLYQSAVDKNSHELEVCDALDVKASILLVVLLFLIDKIVASIPTNQAWQALRAIACLVASVSVFTCAISLWPRNYGTEPLPSHNESWIKALREYFNRDETAVGKELQTQNFDRLKIRANQYNKNNRDKRDMLNVSFYLGALALAMYVPLVFYGR